ncbi:unnamed protein product, partial [Rhizophagus irregularis]|jgi:hypothetical protein
MTDI